MFPADQERADKFPRVLFVVDCFLADAVKELAACDQLQHLKGGSVRDMCEWRHVFESARRSIA